MVVALVSGSLSGRLVYHYHNTHLRLVGFRDWMQCSEHQRLRYKRNGDGRQVDISVRVGYWWGHAGAVSLTCCEGKHKVSVYK